MKSPDEQVASPEQRKKIFIDTCAWQDLHKYNIDLAKELPEAEFVILMTKEVNDFELSCMPKNKTELIEYIELQKKNCQIKIDSFFGFSDYRQPSDYRPRTGGFGEGRWITYEEGTIIKQFEVEKKNERSTGLYKDEADASLAVRACTGGIVLTSEKMTKKGPLNTAYKNGGKVVFLINFQLGSISLRDFIIQSIS